MSNNTTTTTSSRMEIDEHGNKIWYNEKGEYHRDGGMPAVERNNGGKEWWVNGKRHRDGGMPAVELNNGYKSWWMNGQRHRDGGLPAVEWSDGDKEWWVNGIEISESRAIELTRYYKLKEIFE